MRKLARHVFLENEYVGVHVGLISVDDSLLLVDAPLLVDEAREWLEVISGKGRPRYLAFLDSHPDRVLGAMNYDIPIIAQYGTMDEMRGWSDTFKGGAHPIGADADQFKRIVGVQKVVPDLAFSNEMSLYLNELELTFLHRTGPRNGSMWLLIPSERAVFIGDYVTVSQPPYFGAADIDRWLKGLDELRHSPLRDYKIISSRDGLVKRDDINNMARFLRKIPLRLKDLTGGEDDEEIARKHASALLKSYALPAVYEEIAHTRLTSSIIDLHSRLISSD
jgi:glyoxylase-like metal-dependent hydrolase (beta-lactamase superfamily II)